MKLLVRHMDMIDSGSGSWGGTKYDKFTEIDSHMNRANISVLELIEHLGIEKVENELRKLKLKKITSK